MFVQNFKKFVSPAIIHRKFPTPDPRSSMFPRDSIVVTRDTIYT
jgi:hypothetical protein